MALWNEGKPPVPAGMAGSGDSGDGGDPATGVGAFVASIRDHARESGIVASLALLAAVAIAATIAIRPGPLGPTAQTGPAPNGLGFAGVATLPADSAPASRNDPSATPVAAPTAAIGRSQRRLLLAPPVTDGPTAPGPSRPPRNTITRPDPTPDLPRSAPPSPVTPPAPVRNPNPPVATPTQPDTPATPSPPPPANPGAPSVQPPTPKPPPPQPPPPPPPVDDHDDDEPDRPDDDDDEEEEEDDRPSGDNHGHNPGSSGHGSGRPRR